MFDGWKPTDDAAIPRINRNDCDDYPDYSESSGTRIPITDNERERPACRFARRPPPVTTIRCANSTMPELTAANIEQVVQACQANLALIGQSLNQCFDTAFQLTAGDLQSVSGLGDVDDLNGPGLVVGFEVGATAMLCAISAGLPIPDWSLHPDENQTSRLETLAQEWSFHCLPEDLPGDNFVCRAVPHLGDYIAAASPNDAAVCQPVLSAARDEAPVARIWLIWPVSRVPAESGAAESESPARPARHESAASGLPAQHPNPYVRLKNLPVPVIVKLAEKKMELGQLLGIGPGAIITFEKSCEDLLELYVNNHLYCRGEAVKIGEKFGLKYLRNRLACMRGSARWRGWNRALIARCQPRFRGRACFRPSVPLEQVWRPRLGFGLRDP